MVTSGCVVALPKRHEHPPCDHPNDRFRWNSLVAADPSLPVTDLGDLRSILVDDGWATSLPDPRARPRPVDEARSAVHSGDEVFMFELALSALDEDAQRRVRDALAEWRSSPDRSMLAANVEAEIALPHDAFVALLLRFALELTSREGTLQAWVVACRDGGQLQGDPCATPPAVLGRATTLAQHERLLRESPLGATMSADEVAQVLRRVVREGADASARDLRILRQTAIGRYLVWATFDERAPDASPFATGRDTAVGIRAALALGHLALGEPLLLLTYGRPSAPIHRPTIGDADENTYYRPHSDPACPHGYTCPLASEERPRPEVVHRPVTAATLRTPVLLVM